MRVVDMFIEDEEDKLLMIPGPTPVQRQILDALAVPTVSHTSARIADIVTRCRRGIATLAGSQDAAVFIFGGSGTLAQEAAVVNLLPPGERLLVVSNGYFGDRFGPIARAHGIDTDLVTARWGESVTPEELDERMSARQYAAVTLTAVETSTGVLAPMQTLAGVARRHGALVILDAVCALGGLPIGMDDCGLDAVLSGGQKALGVPPGLSILAVSPRGLERRRSLGRVSAYYADLLNWEASMSSPQTYFSTHSVNLFYALGAALDIIAGEGSEKRYDRHRTLGAAFRAGVEALGFGLLTDGRFLAPTMSVVSYPDGVVDADFLAGLSRNGVVAAGCLGEFKGRGARFGHMGNLGPGELLRALAAVERTLHELGVDVPVGQGVAAAQDALVASSPAVGVAPEAVAAGEAPTRAP